MTASIRCIAAAGASVSLDLQSALTAALRDRARAETNQWIKSLRLAPYGGQSMRERFTYRGDSLWWFTEIYLYKMRQLEEAVSVVLALDAAAAAHAPSRMEIDTSSQAARDAARAFGVARAIAIEITGAPPPRRSRAWQSYMVGLSARLYRLKPG